MFSKSKNPKSILSKNLLCEALIRLLEVYPYDDITVLQICEEAQVAKSSFYRNFEKKDDLLDYYITSKIEQMRRIANTAAGQPNSDITFYNFWSNEKPFIRTMSKNNLMPKLNEYYSNFYKSERNEGLIKDSDPFFNDFYYASLTSGQLSTLDVWCKHDFSETPEELVKVGQTMMRKFGKLISKDEEFD